jgi:hypothetical protein
MVLRSGVYVPDFGDGRVDLGRVFGYEGVDLGGGEGEFVD